jgi:hypothetical protein
MLETESVEKFKTHVLCSVNIFFLFFFFENLAVYEKICQATDDNTAHTNYMLDI